MPYIIPGRRKAYIESISNIASLLRVMKSPGELNYVITKLILEVFYDDISYKNIALITGVLENVKQEFYRRIAHDYEDKKKKENGDVY